ncbi:MAG TPA: bi-domain-containing oxidoreductase [Flavipsychrobacter sp.]|nr:bi-domain-containing oxidoreductase [Flavipsychrobacter sp.]
MKQLIQNLKNGDTILEEVPVPMPRKGEVLIKTSCSLISLGTERMLVEFGKAGWINKARQQPDRVKMVLNKIKTDGLRPTIETVFNKLGQPLPLGYCNSGVVAAVGKGVSEVKVGDRVASNGNHAEYVSVPQNLVAKIPDSVPDEDAAFTVIGAIGLQGIRLVNPGFGETVAVIGLGLIGQITAQLLKANGCRVIGIDRDRKKLELAAANGIITMSADGNNDPVKFVQSLTDSNGADAVIITASSKDNSIIAQAANMSRKRGRIVLIGAVGLNISRADFYEKELSFQVSCSYGPGRYDPSYEQKGNDYPIGYVRWTEKRNFEAVLNALATGQLNVKPLITERIPINDYQKVYGNMSDPNLVAGILTYDSTAAADRKIVYTQGTYAGKKGVLGIVGAGNFTDAMVLPLLKKLEAPIKMIASSGGLTGTTLAKKFGIAASTTDYREILKDNEIDTVVITTRPFQHAAMVMEALEAGKHAFVEKPLAIRHDELDELIDVYSRSNTSVSVGFNRRFAPLAVKMKNLLGGSEAPINIVATMNAGFIPQEMWMHDMEVGGGRIISEACHFIDLCSYLAGSLVEAVCMNSMGTNPAENTDNASILLRYQNGSNAVINYFSNGSKAYDKERVEVYSQERTLVMENWRKLTGYGFKNFSKDSSSQDKGHAAQFKLLMENIRSGKGAIIQFEELINTTRASIAAVDSLKKGEWISIL